MHAADIFERRQAVFCVCPRGIPAENRFKLLAQAILVVAGQVCAVQIVMITRCDRTSIDGHLRPRIVAGKYARCSELARNAADGAITVLHGHIQRHTARNRRMSIRIAIRLADNAAD